MARRTGSDSKPAEDALTLALDLCLARRRRAQPYGLGVVLGPGEVAWAEVSAWFWYGSPGCALPTQAEDQLPASSWLATSARVVGRLEDDRLHGWRWEHALGCQVDLAAPCPSLSLDVWTAVGQEKLRWSGPRVAPLAVAAVCALYGMEALLEHPGLASLRDDTAGRSRQCWDGDQLGK